MPTLDDELDRLYQITPSDFVRARNELASRLKKSGDLAASERVMGLSRPSVSAWAVNQLYWTDRPAFERLLEAGDRYREAQRAALSRRGSSGLAEAETDRKEAIENAVRRVREILAQNHQTWSPMVLDRIATTLEALASYGSASATPMKGRLSHDVESPGFGALASLAEVIPFPAPPSEPKEELARAERLLAQEEAALAKAVEQERLAKAELDSARSRLAEAEDRLRQAESDLELAQTHRLEKEAAVEEAKSLWEELRSS